MLSNRRLLLYYFIKNNNIGCNKIITDGKHLTNQPWCQIIKFIGRVIFPVHQITKRLGHSMTHCLRSVNDICICQ